mmetsp:Transcript_4371/g.8260  ORF Transcript_4371/g.8260 Transcript_4371/m.8260 type:complete len:289 (-) Transcript_4371:311-1177(-)|eukprot:CAMPEP_0184523010 /NCGR_PEP_ID=MMETSP0198_2-20121128/8631_1 /TAXON_ID=1112570 /ORGANISM="Thraustochytrium sp., Strain LLF1b" /LENGTH=288 /DNA_ID=CAMNT_0026913963 /DNA_START=344 /DNA_END=1210 /DNA_ORIENTATION=+
MWQLSNSQSALLVVFGCILCADLFFPANGDRDFALTCDIGTEGCQSCDADQDPDNCKCTRQDYAFWVETAFFEFEPVLESCGLSMVASNFDFEVGVECLRKDKIMGEFSGPCNSCFASIMNCTMVICTRDCATLQGRESPECRSCVERLCVPSFIDCAGFTTESCLPSVCEAAIIPGLDNDLFWLIFGGGGGILMLGFCFVVFRLCRTGRDESLLAEVEGDEFQVPEKSSLPLSSSPGSTSVSGVSFSTMSKTGSPSQPSSQKTPLRAGSTASMDFYDMDDFEEKPDI